MSYRRDRLRAVHPGTQVSAPAQDRAPANRWACSWLALLGLVVLLPSATAASVGPPPDLSGLWHGTWEINEYPRWTSIFSMTFWESPYGLLGLMDAPELGAFGDPLYDYLPASITEGPGGFLITIGVPGITEIYGVVDGDTMSGDFYTLYPSDPPLLFTGTWYAERVTGAIPWPGPPPGAACGDLPPLFTPGAAGYASELVLFDPCAGAGYIDHPTSFETEENQYFSYLRRDVMRLIKYATARVACTTADWSYGNHAPLGLGDMSESDGSTPGTSFGYLLHPPGTHEDGRDIDTAYYQLYAASNLCYRPVGPHYEGYDDVYHCVDDPYALDVWRTALYLAYLAEHPRVRVIGVDGRIGPLLENALDDLVALGWIAADLRASIPLAYEVTDTGLGWYYFHHHHLHISVNPVYDFVAIADLKPDTLNTKSQGQFATAHIELDAGIGLDASDIDPTSVALILDGHTMLHALPGRSEIEDFNQNGFPDLTVKFDRQELAGALEPGSVEITIAGSAAGWFFQETDILQVISP